MAAKPVSVSASEICAIAHILGQLEVQRLQECQVVASRHDPNNFGKGEGDVKRRLVGSVASLSRVFDGDGSTEDFLGCPAPTRLHKDPVARNSSASCCQTWPAVSPSNDPNIWDPVRGYQFVDAPLGWVPVLNLRFRGSIDLLDSRATANPFDFRVLGDLAEEVLAINGLQPPAL